jgi:hypothetical protein
MVIPYNMIDYLLVLFTGYGVKLGLDVSFNHINDWEGIREKAVEIISTKIYIYITNNKTSAEFCMGSALVCFNISL